MKNYKILTKAEIELVNPSQIVNITEFPKSFGNKWKIFIRTFLNKLIN